MIERSYRLKKEAYRQMRSCAKRFSAYPETVIEKFQLD